MSDSGDVDRPTQVARTPTVKRHLSAYIHSHVALCQPAVRTVIVAVYSDTDDAGVSVMRNEFYPVVAIRSTISDEYTKKYFLDGPYPREKRTHEEMIESGWSWQCHGIKDEFLVLDTGCGGALSGAESALALDCVNLEWEAAACPWPIEEDKVRLEGVIVRLAEQVGIREMR